MPNVDDQRIRELIAGRRTIRRAPFPGSLDVEIGVRVLRDSEIDDARFAATAYLEKRCKKAALTLAEFLSIDPDMLDREHQRQIIWRATFDPELYDANAPDKSPPFFPSDSHVRDLDASLVQCLWGLYMDLLDAVDPRVRLTEEQVEELLDALGKAPNDTVLLAAFAPATLASCLRTLAARRETSPTGSSHTSSAS